MAVATFPIGPLQTNSYLISSGNQAVAIDVGGDPAPMLEYLNRNSLELAAILLTHLHFDHQFGVADLSETTSAPVYVPEGDSPIAETETSRGGVWGLPKIKPYKAHFLSPGQTSFGNMKCIVLLTPGHTPGSLSYYFPDKNCVFSGDVLFNRSIGRTDFPMGDHEQLLQSIKTHLFTLPDDTIVYPGHGASTTIGSERIHNPFFRDFVD